MAPADPTETSRHPSDDDERLEELVECLLGEMLDDPDAADPSTRLDEIARTDPDLADRVRARLLALRELGLVGRTGPGRPAAIAPAETAARGGSDRDGDLAGGASARLGPYLLQELLGSGGQGRVHAALDTRLGRRVALKTLSGHFASPRARQRLQREADSLSRVDHPAVCAVYEVGEDAGTPWIAMRLVDGEPLSERIAAARAVGARRITLPGADHDATTDSARRVDEVLALFEECARGLHHAHEAGVVHRDVKPQNVLVTADGRPVLVDFGLAHVRGEAEELTRTGDLLGTPAYMSPEQLRGRRTDRRTDVWSLAATLQECLTLQRPFDEDLALGGGTATVEDRLRARTTQAPSDPRRTDPALPRDLVTVLSKALEADPALRYATAREFAEDLAAVRGSRPVSARPVTWFGRSTRWARREPTAAILAAVLALGLPVVAGLALYLQSQAPEAAAGRDALRRGRWNATIERGFLALGEGRLEAAAGAFDDALGQARTDDEKADAFAGRALTDVFGAEPQQGVARLEALPDATLEARPDLRLILARGLRRVGQVDEAERVEASIDAEAAGPFARFVRGLARRNEAERRTRGLDLPIPPGEAAYPEDLRALWDEAVDDLHAAALGSRPPRQIFHAWAGRAASEAGREAIARTFASSIVGLWPDSADSWAWSALMLAPFDPAAGFEASRRALELDPGRADLMLTTVLTAAMDGDLPTAFAIVEDAEAKLPDNPDPPTVRGILLSAQGDDEAAERLWREVLERHPEADLAHSALASLYRRDGRDDELQRLDRLRDTASQVLERRALEALDAGRREDARALFLRAADAAGTDPERRAALRARAEEIDPAASSAGGGG